MVYKPPPTKTKCKNCGRDIVLEATYSTPKDTGRLYCDPQRSANQAEPK